MNPSKLHASLAVTLSAKGVDDAEIPVILRLRPGPVARGEMQALAQIKPTAVFRLMSAQAVTATSEMIAALTEDPAVDLIWPDLPVHTWIDQAAPIIGAPRVWDTGFTGRGVTVAVLDTGLDPDHPDFANRVMAYQDFVEPDTPGSQPRDPNGHGSHVAGIVVGTGEASGGKYQGLAPGAELVVGRVLDASGNGRTSTVMAGMEWAVDQGAQVINVSLGGPPYPADGTDAFSTLCNAAVEQGAVVCVAAGNLGPGGHTIGSPAAAARPITVGASESKGGARADQVAAFSSRGPTGDGRVKPDLIFPGFGIVAPRSAGTSLGSPLNEKYTALSGTSQATPMASGTAALLLEANPKLTPDDIKARMMRGARLLPDTDPNSQGRGRGDCYNTFVSAEGEPLEPPRSPTDPTAPGVTPPAPKETPDPPETRSGCLPGVANIIAG